MDVLSPIFLTLVSRATLVRMKKEDACRYRVTAKLSLACCISCLAEPATAINGHNLGKSNYMVNTHLHI